MIFLWSLACTDKISPSESDLGYVVIDSGHVPVDTSETADTSTPIETHITLYPQTRALNIGAHIALRAVLSTEDHPPETLSATWTSSDSDVIQIEGQTARAIAPGSAVITAETAIDTQAFELSVLDNHSITLHVLNPEDLSPVEGMTVTHNNDIVGSTDSNGSLEISTDDLESISIYQQGYIPISILSIPSTDIYLPAIPISETMKPMIETSGSVDFTHMPDADFNEVSIAITIPKQRNILSVTLNDLFRSVRPVSLFGTEANIPSSVSLGSYDESFSVMSHLENPQLSTFAINAPTLSLTEAANETDPFQLVAPLIPDMRFGSDSASPNPSHGLYALPAPTVHSPPIEFTDPAILLFHGISDSEHHFENCGLGIADSSAPTVYTSSASRCSTASLFAAAIFDSEEDTHRSSIVHSQDQSFPPFLATPKLLSFDPSDKSVSLGLSSDAQLVQVWIRAADGSQRILYLPPHYDSFILPTPPFPMGYGNTTWSIQQVQLTHGTYKDWLAQPQSSFTHALQASQASGLIRFQLIQ